MKRLISCADSYISINDRSNKDKCDVSYKAHISAIGDTVTRKGAGCMQLKEDILAMRCNLGEARAIMNSSGCMKNCSFNEGEKKELMSNVD